jgi:hypothetical protein
VHVSVLMVQTPRTLLFFSWQNSDMHMQIAQERWIVDKLVRNREQINVNPVWQRGPAWKASRPLPPARVPVQILYEFLAKRIMTAAEERWQ